MKKYQIFIILLLLTSLSLSLQGIGLNPIKPYHLNKGKLTKYLFSMQTEEQIISKAQIKVTFPAQFDQSQVASNLQCMAKSDSYAWKSVSCSYVMGSVILTMGTIKDQKMYILISSPKNPTKYEMSSYFQICLLYNSSPTSCEKQFGKVVFPAVVTSSPVTSTFPSVTSLSSRRVGKASTYQFRFNAASVFQPGNTIRVTFPDGYTTSANPICQMTGTYNQIIQTFTWPNKRSIQCQKINKQISTGEVLKIIGIYNPTYSGVFGNNGADGFAIQILQGSTTTVKQELFLLQTITMQAGQMEGYIIQSDNFIKAKSRYTFYLNLQNALSGDNQDYIKIRMLNSWIFYENQCSVVAGINLYSDNRLNCANSTDGTYTYLKVTNFKSATITTQLVFNVYVGTPIIEGTFPVNVITANTKGVIDSLDLNVVLNSTYGTLDMLSINAITANAKVPVAGTGPLQLTFFLNHQLPQTNVLTQGRFVLKIYPQIPNPPSFPNGVLKCYFFNDIPADTCYWDNSINPGYTLVTIKTPSTVSFKYSQIPITITTEGAQTEDKIGITIADKVTRYRFELQAYKQDSNTIPTEVFYSEYIADSIYLALTCTFLTKEVSQYTAFKIEYNNPYTFDGALMNNIRLKVEFLGGGGWAVALGYQADRIYKRYPCIFYTVDGDYDANVQCDLYTYVDGPHASLTDSSKRGPYILMYGFSGDLILGDDYRLQFPKFLIGSSHGTSTKLRFSIIEETSSMLTKQIQLYYNQFEIFTTVSEQIESPVANGVTLSVSDTLINIGSTQSPTFTVGSNAEYIVYQYDRESTPQFDEKFVNCTNDDSLCSYFGYPVNWIIQYHDTGQFASSVASVFDITTGIYSGTYPGLARAFSSGLTIYKGTFNIVYTPNPITNAYYYKQTTNTLYKNTETYFGVYFYQITTTPTNSMIRLTLDSDTTFGPYPYCESSNLPLYLPNNKLQCVLQNSGSVLKIYNLGILNAGSRYDITFRLQTGLTTADSIRPTITMQTYYSYDVDYSVVDQITNHQLNETIPNTKITPEKFEVENPKVTQQLPREGYIGKLSIKFRPTTDSLNADSIVVELPQHQWNGAMYTTPGNVATDPLVCLVNNVRVSCTYTLTSTLFRIVLAAQQLTSGTDNQITLDTEYLVENGIKHPSEGGQYICVLQFYGSTLIQSTSFYLKVLAQAYRNLYVTSAMNDIGYENLFMFEIFIQSRGLASYSHGTQYGRIYFEFPTVDELGNSLFEDDLGGYSQTGQYVGCDFNVGTYYVDSPTNDLRCRLIKSEVPGEPAIVEMLNFQALSGSNYKLQVWIARVHNPTRKVASFPLSVRMFEVNVATNHIYEKYYETYHVFVNGRTASPVTGTSINCNNYADAFEDGREVGDINAWFRIYPRIQSGYSAGSGYYYVIKLPKDFIPNYREVSPFDYCDLTNDHYQCLSFRDISWVIIHSHVNPTTSQIRVNVQLPFAISQPSYNIPAMVWQAQRYLYIDQIIMIASCQNQFRGTLSSYSGVSSVDDILYGVDINRRYFPVRIQFNVRHSVPKGGSIQIKWGSGVPKAYPHCRSMTNIGSVLTAVGGTQNGEIGCLVQSTRSWVVTQFNTLPAGSVVILMGHIDLPTAANTNLGIGEVITYNGTHPTAIRQNGFVIDIHADSDFELATSDETSFNFDTEITLEETLPLRISHSGPLQFKFKLASNFPGLNLAKMRVRIPKRSIYGQTGGFSYVSSKKIVCSIKQILTHQQYGCIVTAVTDDTTTNYENIMFEMISSSTLSSTLTYTLKINTYTGISPQGLLFPTVASTYKVDVSFDIDNSGGYNTHNHLYLEVYGTQFTELRVYSFVTIQNQPNLIWVKLKPTTTISITDQIVIQIPTMSANGITTIFANDLGLGIADGNDITTDIIGGAFTNSFMKCRLFHGDQANGKSARIICGGFTESIQSSQQLYFAFKIRNPDITGQMSIPFFIYSQNIDKMVKTNFNVVQNAVMIRTTYLADVLVQSGNIVTGGGSNQMQTAGTTFQLTARNGWSTNSEDFYILMFNFPIRNNGIITGGCTDAANNVYGDAFYHQNLWMIACSFTSSTMGYSSPSTATRNLKIKEFYTPWFYLSPSEQVITTYHYHYNVITLETSKGVLSDGFPNNGPKQSVSPQLTVTPIHNSQRYRGVRDDLLIQFVYSNLNNNDISYAKLIAFILPTTITIIGKDCVQAPSSNIQIEECWLEVGSRNLWIRPVQKSVYRSTMAIAVKTLDLAISYPTGSSSINYNAFIVKFYAWQNRTQASLSINTNTQVHAFLRIGNFPSATMSFGTNPSGYAPTTFDYLMFPHQRYYKETPYSRLTQRAPFEFIFAPSVQMNAASGSNYHQISVYYGSDFTGTSQNKIRDLQFFRPYCYLDNKRIRVCTCDIANNKITMSFQFALTQWSSYHIMFGLIDPRNADILGFLATKSVSDIRIQYIVSGSSNVYYTESQKFPSLFSLPSGANQGPFRGITDGSIVYGHAIQDNINAVSMTLTFNRTDITALVFQIPLLDSSGNTLYDSSHEAGSFLNLQDGAVYPCGNNGLSAGGNVKCILKMGQFGRLTSPTKIIMTDFTYVTQMNCRFIFTNPSQIGSSFSIKVKAYGGQKTSSNLYGDLFMGEWQFEDVFQTISSVTYAPATNSYDRSNKRIPSQSPWRNNTIDYVFSKSTSIGSNRISLARVLLQDSGSSTYDDQFCVATLGSGNSYDDLLEYTYVASSGSRTYRYAYYMRVWSSSTDCSYSTGTGWDLKYLKCKYYQPSYITYWYFSDTSIQVATNTFTVSNGYSLATSAVSIAPINKYYDHTGRLSTAGGYITVEMDITPTVNALTNFEFRNGDEMVLLFEFTNAYWSSMTECHVIGGIVSTAATKRTKCFIASVSKLYIRYIAGFQKDPSLPTSTNIRIKFLTKISSFNDATTATNKIITSLYSNFDSYSNTYQSIFNQQSNLVNNCYTQFQDETCTYIHSASYGAIQLKSATDTSMVVIYTPYQDYSYSTTAYSQRFDINMNGFDYGTGATVSNVIFEISSSKTAGSGTNNTVNPTIIDDSDHFRFTFTGNKFSDIWGGVGLASNNVWNSNQYIIVYITIAPGTVDLPVLNHAYVFIIAAYNYNNDQIRGNVAFLPTQPLGTAASIATITNSRGAITELSMQIKQLKTKIGSGKENFLLLAEFSGSSGWTGSNDPFSAYTNTALDDQPIECKCISAIGPLSISTTTPYVDTKCRRRLPTSAPFNTFAILISHNADIGQDVKCFFPEFKIEADMSFSVQYKVIYGDTYPIDLTGSKAYGSVFRITSNTLTFPGTSPGLPAASFLTFNQSPNFYLSSANVGTVFSTSTYVLQGTWNTNQNMPYIYVNYFKAGPVPAVTFCSDSNVYAQCRVYTKYLNIVIGRLRATSTKAFSMSRGGSDISYPSSQYVSSSEFKALIYVTSADRWHYYKDISRSQSSLQPISTNSFLVYSDLYGSSRSTFENTVIISMNIAGKTLYNNLKTGSKIQITFSSISHKYSCQSWVQYEPSVELTCIIQPNKITIYSLRDDYTTSNNIFVTMGITNPTSSSNTFTMKLYDYYYSVSRYSLVISKNATLTIDNSYVSKVKVSQKVVSLLPFRSRFSLVANSPLRMRFKLSTSTINYATSNSGVFVIKHPQFTYSSNFLCFFKMYNNYQNMDQDTQGTLYKATRYSKSSSTLYVYPPKSHGISSSKYYQLIIMPLDINAAGCAAFGCATQSGFQQQNFEQINIVAYSAQTTPTIINQQVQNLYAYEGSFHISLQQIYVLCAQPQQTSLYFKFALTFASTNNYPAHYLQFIFWDLSASNFPGFSTNDQIPCQLSPNFLSISNRQDIACILAEADNVQGFVKVRIINIGSLVVGVYWMTLDDITLPTPNSASGTGKFDMSIRYMGPNNLKYQNYFREIFLIDNTNSTSAVALSASVSNPSITQYGTSVVGTMSFNWPFTTTSSGYESKVSFNIKGGYSATWNDIDAVTFVDNAGTYQLLWVNKKLNKFVFALPGKSSSTSTTLNITALSNPYPYQKQDYEANSNQIQINFYRNYFRHSSNTISQPSFSIYTRPVPIVNIDQNLPSNSIDIYPLGGATANKIANGGRAILRLGVVIDEEPVDIVARKLDVLDIQFTAGVSFVEQCRVVRNSTLYVNPKSTCQTQKIGSNWHVIVYYVTESQLGTDWWLQVVIQFNAASLQYTSQLKARNSIVEYQSSYTVSLSNYYATTKIKPTRLEWLNRKYVKNFYENQWRYLYAVSGQSTPYFRTRLRVDRLVNGDGDTKRLYLRSTTVFAPSDTTHIKVTLLPAVSAQRDFGIGCWGQGRRLNEGNGNYYIQFTAMDCWQTGKDYLLQIQQENIVTTNLQAFTSPTEFQMSFYVNVNSALDDWDQMRFKPKASFNSVEIRHTTTTVNDYDTLTITYNPSISVTAGTSSTQTVLILDVSGLYHEYDGGLTSIYSGDGTDIQSGIRFSEVVSNPTGNQVTTVNFAQYSNKYTPLSFCLTKAASFVAGTNYVWRIPMIKNPSNPYTALRYNLSLIHYPSGADFGIVKNFYQSVNQYYTVADTSASFNPTITNSNKNVQVTANIDLSIDLASYSLNQWNVVNFKLDNSYDGLIQDFTSGSDTSNYNYYYFHTINMVMAQKKTINTVTNVGIGSASSSLNYQRYFKFAWVRIYDTSNAVMTTNPKTLKYGGPPSLLLNYLTSYTSTAINKLQGTEYQGSTVMYKIDVTVPIIPEGGQIKIIIDSTKISTDSGAHCKVGANFVRSGNNAQVLRCYRFTNGYIITGFSTISANTPLSLYIPIRSTSVLTASNIGIQIYGIYTDATSSISKKANSVTVTHAADSVPSTLTYKKQIFTEIFGSYYTNIDYYYQLEGSLTLRATNLFNNDYIRLNIPLARYGDLRMLIKKNDSSVQWTELNMAYGGSTNNYFFYTPTNYEIDLTLTTSVEYIWKLTTVRGAEVSGQYNGLITQSWDRNFLHYWSIDNSVYIQYTYEDLTVTPKPRVLTINNNYPAAGKKTMLDLGFTVDIDISGDFWIQVTFDTHNLLSEMFAEDLENEPENGQQFKYVDCRQWGGNNYIQGSRMICLLYYGDNSVSPPIPARIVIPMAYSLNGYPTPFTLRFTIANVKNPSTENMNVGVILKMYQYCVNKYNRKCGIMEARGYYVTKSGNQNLLPTSGLSPLFTPSSTNILDTSITHTIKIATTASVTSSDAIYIFYPKNFEGVLQNTCTAGGSYTCYAYPKPRWIVLLPSSTVISAAGTLTITLSSYMNNGYYTQAFDEYIVVKVSRGSGAQIADVYNVPQNPFTTIKKSISSGIATSMTISATQNNNVFLRNYANTVQIDLKNIYMDQRIKAIYIKAPSDVTQWDTEYCNGSITATSGPTLTYPLRFTCRAFSENTTVPVIQLIPEPADLGTYNAIWDDYTLKIHVKFTLDEFPTTPILYTSLPITSGTFHAYGSVNLTSDNPKYYLSECLTTIQISQHQVPIISDVTFNQKSFAYRTARVGNKQVFYLLLKPTVTNVITKMVFEIPDQFDYPGIFEHDNCFMIGRVKEDQNQCKQSREGGKTLLTIIPQNYDNEVKIIQLGSLVQQNWFTAPELPGNFYNMTVQLYGIDGSVTRLLQKQTIDISPVYGQYFDLPSIDIQNILDGGIKQSIYDIQFITGTLQIPPGATTTATNMRSELQFIFQNYNPSDSNNVFQNDLGTGLSEGDQIGCVIRDDDIVALQGKRLKCILHIGLNSTDKPIIKIINFDYIDPQTTIKVSFAGIQSLDQNGVNTISIGVLIYYQDINSSTYLYIPTAKLPQFTNNTIKYLDYNWVNPGNGASYTWLPYWDFYYNYTGNNIVRQTTTFSIRIRPPYNYPSASGSPLTYSSGGGTQQDFILIKLQPKFMLDPYNTVPIQCSNTSDIEVFYATGIIRFRLNSDIAGSGYHYYTFNNFPSSAYSVANQPMTIDLELYEDYRLFSKYTWTNQLRTYEKCSLFNFGVLSVSSLNGGQIGVSYTFSMITNHYIPSNGAVSITIPKSYGDMVTNGVTCRLEGFTSTNVYCLIQTPSRVDLYLNGSQLSQTSSYKVILAGLQNPNQDSSGLIFYLTSYYSANIYESYKICENSVTPPTITVKAVRTCTLSWSVSYVNKNFNATYTFVLSCNDLFRGSSILYIKLPSQFSTKNNLGNISCTSLQSATLVKDICHLAYINGEYTLWTELEATSQTSLTLLTNFINPTNNTYKASASVKSRGVAYANTADSYLTLLSTNFTQASSRSVFLMNSPKEAGLMATYIFKISPITTFSPNNLGIQFPKNFYIKQSELIIGITTTQNSAFFQVLNYDNVQKIVNNASAVTNISLKAYPTFTVDSNKIFIKQISSHLVSNEWTYVFIRGIKNPSEYLPYNFTVAYYIDSTNYKTLQWIMQSPLTYKISSPPKYLSIETVEVSDHDLLFPSVYKFKFKSGSGQPIAIQGVKLSYVVVIPNFYKSTVWANSKFVCKFDELAIESPCQNYESQIIITETFATNLNSLTITISKLLNPALQTYCSTDDVTLLSHTFFRIRIIEVESNKFMFESSSVVDGNNCLKFLASRIPISLEHSLTMIAGLAYNITYSITKPAMNLKIKAIASNTGFTFSPSVVQFNDYYALKKVTTIYLRSDITPGPYTIKFQKFQSQQQTYFRNILPITITVVSSTSSNFVRPTITIPQMSVSTIGHPVTIPIKFSLPSSTQMTLFIKISEQSNQTLTQYSSSLADFTLEPRIINIIPQKSDFTFVVTHKQKKVPPKLTLTFTITSVYTIIHNLTTTQMTLCFTQDPTYDVLYPPLKVSLNKFASSCNGGDVGKKITNIFATNGSQQSSSAAVSPEILNLITSNIKSTVSRVTVFTRTSGIVYYLCVEAGYPIITDPQEIISLSKSDIGKTGYVNSTAQNVYIRTTAQINHQGIVNLQLLTSETKYNFYAVLDSELGTSNIKMISFQTTDLSRGVLMKFSFSDVVQPLDIVKILEKIIRVSPLRIKVLTSTYQLQQIKNNLNQNHNNPKYIYEVVIAPDSTNDTNTPMDIVRSFINSNESLDSFKQGMPNWNRDSKIPYHQLRPVKPRVTVMPKVNVIHLYNATFSIKFWERSSIYAVLIRSDEEVEDSLSIAQQGITVKRVSELSVSEKALAPSSQQISYGKNKDNINLGKYQKLVTQTDSKGDGVLVFNDLKEGSSYNIYITSSSPLEYPPPIIWQDEEVILVNFKTIRNPNLKAANRHIDELKKYNPGLGQAIERFIKNEGNKQNMKNSSN